MRPVLSIAEMREADAEALSTVSETELVERAGAAVAAEAVRMLGSCYARRVVVVAGKGNNGNDGRVAARLLAAKGAKVEVIDAARAPEELPACDLVIDAAYGTGFKGGYTAPCAPPSAEVLSVDIPSGVDGDTGCCPAGGVEADVTVTFAALKPGLLIGPGRQRAGRVHVADIGVGTDGAGGFLVEDQDVATAVPARRCSAHKWSAAVVVVAGSPGMTGAASMASMAALRCGAGMVRLCIPGAGIPGAGGAGHQLPSGPFVSASLPEEGWADALRPDLARAHALVIGPGLGRDRPGGAGRIAREVAGLLSRAAVPAIVDADGLYALGTGRAAAEVLASRPAPTVLTPHEAELARLLGHPVGADRVRAARDAARDLGCAVLYKGPVTVVAAPGGQWLASSTGDQRLATAGTGDVLSGVIGAFVARGTSPIELAAALGAHAHGRAAELGHAVGLVASDLPELLARWLSALAER
ncbi:MAG: NAD(P)H-hydrate dehydratase [Acidimicrobiales bacterium]